MADKNKPGWLKEGYGNLDMSGENKIDFFKLTGSATKVKTATVRFLRDIPMVVDRHSLIAYGTTVPITCSGDSDCPACNDGIKIKPNRGFYEVMQPDGEVVLLERGKKDNRKIKMLNEKEGGLTGRPVEINRSGKTMQDTEYTFNFKEGSKVKKLSEEKIKELLDGYDLAAYLTPPTVQEYKDIINEVHKKDEDGKTTKKGNDKNSDDKFTDMERNTLKIYIKKNNLDIKVFSNMTDDDIRGKIREEL